MPEAITLRPVAPGDELFLRALYASTREEELAPLGWTGDQVNAFLDMQYRAREAHYEAEYAGSDDCVVLADGVPAGRLDVYRDGQMLHIIDIAIAPGHRGRGIGTGLLGQVIAEASAAGRVDEQYVEAGNPAQRLYRRMGFVPAGEVPPYYRMEWRPGAGHVSGGQPNVIS
jgi:ribosomal protein S18 acetylase RimI-like enzyme